MPEEFVCTVNEVNYHFLRMLAFSRASGDFKKFSRAIVDISVARSTYQWKGKK